MIDFYLGGGGEADIFPKVYLFSHGIKFIPSEYSFCQGVRVFSGGGVLNFFLEVVQFVFFLGGGRIHLKIRIFS